MLKTNTRYVHDFAKRTLTVTVNARYMSTGKEVNDLRCVAADIAESIKRGLPESTDFFQMIAAYQSWLKRFFVYKKDRCYARPRRCGALADAAGRVPGNRRAFHGDFAAPWHFGAVRLRRRLLRYGLGPARVERGMGAERRMAPVDFTFGLHRKTTPNTFTPPDDLHFRELHRWDEVAQSPALFQNVQTLENRLQAKTFCCSRTTRSRPRSAASRCCLTSCAAKRLRAPFAAPHPARRRVRAARRHAAHCARRKNAPHSVRHADFKRLCADKRGLSAKRLLHRRTVRRGGCGEA